MVTMAVAMFSAVVTPGMEMVSALQTVLMSMSMSMSTIPMLMFLVSKSLLVRKLVLLHHRFGIHTIMVGVVMMLMLISVFVMHKVVATMLGHEGNNDGE
jgi:threonine/homoserine/homoserine lactone efflux protein